MLTSTVVKFPVGDIRFPTDSPPWWTKEQLKGILESFGFAFSGPVDEDGLQEATIPEGWSTEGEFGDSRWFIKDEKGRKRISVITKIPWGDMDYIHFAFLEPAFPRATDPSDGW
jgi:hypothetical protein